MIRDLLLPALQAKFPNADFVSTTRQMQLASFLQRIQKSVMSRFGTMATKLLLELVKSRMVTSTHTMKLFQNSKSRSALRLTLSTF
jgi:hypothetical protein